MVKANLIIIIFKVKLILKQETPAFMLTGDYLYCIFL